jgi:hypothetical protein
MQKEKARKQIGGFQEPHYHGNMEQGVQLFYGNMSLQTSFDLGQEDKLEVH